MDSSRWAERIANQSRGYRIPRASRLIGVVCYILRALENLAGKESQANEYGSVDSSENSYGDEQVDDAGY